MAIGSGAPMFAAAFREEFDLDFPVLCDEARETFTLLGLKRGVGKTLGLGAMRYGLGAFVRGHRSGLPQGDTWQQGGALVVHPDGSAPLAYVSGHTGDHVDIDALLASLGRWQGAA